MVSKSVSHSMSSILTDSSKPSILTSIDSGYVYHWSGYFFSSLIYVLIQLRGWFKMLIFKTFSTWTCSATKTASSFFHILLYALIVLDLKAFWLVLSLYLLKFIFTLYISLTILVTWATPRWWQIHN